MKDVIRNPPVNRNLWWNSMLTNHSSGYIYSQTCIKRSPFGIKKKWSFKMGDLFFYIKKKLNSYEIVYDRTKKKRSFKTGDCLIKVTAWVGLTVNEFELVLWCIVHIWSNIQPFFSRTKNVTWDITIY